MRLLFTALACLIYFSVLGQCPMCKLDYKCSLHRESFLNGNSSSAGNSNLNLIDKTEVNTRIFWLGYHEDRGWCSDWYGLKESDIKYEFYQGNNFPTSFFNELYREGFGVERMENTSLWQSCYSKQGLPFGVLFSNKCKYQKVIESKYSDFWSKAKQLHDEGYYIKTMTYSKWAGTICGQIVYTEFGDYGRMSSWPESSRLVAVFELGAGGWFTATTEELISKTNQKIKSGYEILGILPVRKVDISDRRFSTDYRASNLVYYRRYPSENQQLSQKIVDLSNDQSLGKTLPRTGWIQRFTSFNPYDHALFGLYEKVSSDKAEYIEMCNEQLIENPLKKSKPPLSSGSCVLLDVENGIWVTNAHVVEGSDNLTILVGGLELNPIIIALDSQLDLAILKTTSITNMSSIYSIPLCNNSQLGDEVYSIGYPMLIEKDGDITVTEGIISSMSFLGDRKKYQISCPITYGSSGGALISKDGCLVGITHSGYRPDLQTENVNAAIKNSNINLLLDKPLSPNGNSDSFSESTKGVFPILVSQ